MVDLLLRKLAVNEMPNILCWITGHVFHRHGDFLVCQFCGKRVEVSRR